MDRIIEIFASFSLPVLIAAVAAVLTVIILLLKLLSRRKNFHRALTALAAEPDLERPDFLGKYPMERLMRKSAGIVDLSRKSEVNLPGILGMGEFWSSRYMEKPNGKLEEWILEFSPDQGLFPIFQRALDHRKTADKLAVFLENSHDFLKLRRIALAGKGAAFDGFKGLTLFGDRMDEVREMTGDPEWAARFFAINILLHDDEDRSARAVWESFSDPHALVRATVVRDIDLNAHSFNAEKSGESELFSILNTLLLNDPVFEVRKAAKDRIMKDFKEQYSVKLDTLSNEQILHVIQLLSPESEEDQDLAVSVLGGDDLELRQAAAYYLQGCGVLDRLFNESYMNDLQQLERNYDLLNKALEVNVCDFLNGIRSNHNRGSLLLASRLLMKAGPRDAIVNLGDRVFAQEVSRKEDVSQAELYENTLACIRDRGTDEALGQLSRELIEIKGRDGLLHKVMGALPERGAYLFMPVLGEFLTDPGFTLKDELREVMKRMPASAVQNRAMDILRGGRDRYSHDVRILALMILGDMKRDSCLQILLENLPVLPLEEAREFTGMLSSYSEDLFNERVRSILNSVDARSRAALIASLPVTGKKTFIKEIRESLDDVNPDVRIASIWSLIEYGESKELSRCLGMLRDPIPRVRCELARAMGGHGSPAVLKELESVLRDENEVESVVRSVIEGLSEADNSESVEMLVRKLAEEDDFRRDCIRGLSRRSDKKSIRAIIELFKDAGPRLREDLSSVFKIMGYEGEQTMLALLKEEIPSLHRYIAEVLESTGFVETHIRKLKHRDAGIRRESASFLAAIRTKSAFRGIVLAARDPNREVRVEVTKALEILNSEDGKGILKELENDPDRKVRKYTYWALERIRTKSLD